MPKSIRTARATELNTLQRVLGQELSRDLRTLYEDHGGIRSRSRLPMRMLSPTEVADTLLAIRENFPDLLDEVPAYSGPTTTATIVGSSQQAPCVVVFSFSVIIEATEMMHPDFATSTRSAVPCWVPSITSGSRWQLTIRAW